MSQVGVSRPVSHQLKLGVALPEIKHPLSRMSNPENMDVRGVSRSGDRPASHPPAPSGRPLASEVGSPLRKSVSATGRESRLRKDGAATAASVVIDNIPEGVEVKYGDPGTTRLPVFGEWNSWIKFSLFFCLFIFVFCLAFFFHREFHPRLPLNV